jgi:transposase-like protein
VKKNTFFDTPKLEILSLDEIARQGAQTMLGLALTAEIQSFIESMSDIKLPDGRPAIVLNGHHKPRSIAVGSGQIEVAVPRTRDRRGKNENFTSSIIPPYMRRSPKIDELIPLLYLRGLSTGDIYPALSELLGSTVSGLSPANVSRLKSCWDKEYSQWQKRSLKDKKYCYIWADGIHFNVRLSDNRLCILVIIGATKSGKKELIAVTSGYRESKESWLYVLNDLKSRGMASPILGIGDGALGFWAALAESYPNCKEQRCWVHKTANVLDKLPKSLQGKAKAMIHDIYMAESSKSANKAFDIFINTFENKYPKATECLEKDRDRLLTFYSFPANHWKHIRSTNTIESPFATVRLRTNKTRGHGTETTTFMMVYKLLEQASKRWHKLAGSNIIPLILAGAIFEDGELKKAA